MRARTSQRCVVLYVVRLLAWPIDVCSNKDTDKGESELPDTLRKWNSHNLRQLEH